MTPSFRSVGPMIITLLLVGLSPFSPVGISSLHKAYAATRSVSLVGYASTGWNGSQPSGPNPQITIMQGDTLVITTSQGDTLPHHFFVDVDRDPVNPMSPDCAVDKCAKPIPPTSTDTLTGFTQGTYFYYCEYHTTMKGTFTVQPSPDFSISLGQSSLSIVVGSSGNATITLTSQNGFSGSVNLAATVSPSGPATSVTPVMVSLTSGGSATSRLSITTSSGVYSSISPGSYTVTVTGTGSPSLSHSVTLSVTVTSPSSPAAGIPGSVIIIAGVVIAAAAVVIGVAVLRRKTEK